MKQKLLTLADIWLSPSKAYRRWRGGAWVWWFEPDYGDWTTGLVLWERVGDGEFSETERDDEKGETE